MQGPTCPHHALSWLGQIRHDSMILLYQAFMYTGGKASADPILPAIELCDPVRFCQA